MTIHKILNSLDNSWDRQDILSKIKNGLGTNEIVNEFLKDNEVLLKELDVLLRPEDLDLLTQVEKLLTCESELIKKINNLKNKGNHQIINEKDVSLSNIVSSNIISSLMINWSNKVVVIALLTISAIALSKQAWA